MRALLLAAAAAAAAGGAAAMPVPYIPRFFGDNMVLQRSPAAARVWGWSTPGDAVTGTVTCPGSKSSGAAATAGSDGLFVIALPPQPPTKVGDGCALNIAGGNFSITYSAVVFGDVFLCGGQSNMHLPLDYEFNATTEIASAPSYAGVIRLATFDNSASATVPMPDALSMSQYWDAGDAVSGFSAICWETARHLVDALGGPHAPGAVTLGLIHASAPSTYISQHSPVDVLRACGAGGGSDGPKPDPSAQCSGDACKLWYGFYSPLAVGQLAVTGMWWAQGETDRTHPAYYNCALPAFITSLRKYLGNPGLYFNALQLAPWIANSTGGEVALLRDAQANASRALPNVSMAVQLDNGDPQAPAGSIHPRGKIAVGQRMAWQTAAVVYGRSELDVYNSPAYASATAGPAAGASGVLTATVHLSGVGGATGVALTTQDASCPTSLGVPPALCSSFAIIGSDGVTYPASFSINADGASLTLSAHGAPAGTAAAATSFGFSDWPVVEVFSSLGLPLAPWVPTPVGA